VVAAAAAAAAAMIVVVYHRHCRNLYVHEKDSRSNGGIRAEGGGRNSFANDPAARHIDWQLRPSDNIYFVIALSILPRRSVVSSLLEAQ